MNVFWRGVDGFSILIYATWNHDAKLQIHKCECIRECVMSFHSQYANTLDALKFNSAYSRYGYVVVSMLYANVWWNSLVYALRYIYI